MPDELDPNQPDPTPADPSADVAAAHGEPDPHSLPPLTTAPVTSPTREDADPDADVDDAGSGGATESLAGALAVSFKVLRVVLLGLIVIFLFSGFFTVKPNEVAVRTRFGKIQPRAGGGDVLTADGGPYFRWPAPVGQVYRIPTSDQIVQLDTAFVFAGANDPSLRGRRLAEIAGPAELDPAIDGALLTGDKSLLHARFTVSYRITPDGAADFIRNVARVDEIDLNTDDQLSIFRDADTLVRSAVEAAIVTDVAGTRLDELLTTGRTDQPAAAAPTTAPADAAPTTAPANASASAPASKAQLFRAQAAAQRTLDELKSGISLVSVTFDDRTVPVAVRPAFDELATAIQNRAQLQRQAEGFSQGLFTAAAGPAYPAVLAVVDVFEDADRTRDARPEFYASAETALNAMLDGRPMDQVLPTLADALPAGDPRRDRLRSLGGRFANGLLGGRASSTVNNAQRQVTQYLSTLQADVDVFEGLLTDYRKAPETVRQQLFLKTLSSILSGADSTSEVLPGGGNKVVRLLLNPEPPPRDPPRPTQNGGGGPGQ